MGIGLSLPACKGSLGPAGHSPAERRATRGHLVQVKPAGTTKERGARGSGPEPRIPDPSPRGLTPRCDFNHNWDLFKNKFITKVIHGGCKATGRFSPNLESEFGWCALKHRLWGHRKCTLGAQGVTSSRWTCIAQGVPWGPQGLRISIFGVISK